MPIQVPAGVTVAIKDELIHVKGPKGALNCKMRDEVALTIGSDVITVEPVDESKAANSFQGLYRQLVHNMVVGVSKGYSKSLIINGVGFRADLKGNVLSLNLGFAQPIDVVVPDDITVTVDTPTKVTFSGIDKQRVGQFAAEVRSLRKPEPYKGKGIRYEDEVIRRKAGKTASGKK